MGIFYEMKVIVNRAPIELTGRFDGQDIRIPPGESAIPAIAVNYAKNQNPIMGKADPNNPSLSGGQYLIAVKGVDDCTPLTKEEWEAHLGRPCRLDWEALAADRYENSGKKLVVAGKGAKTQAKGSFDQGVRFKAPEAYSEQA